MRRIACIAWLFCVLGLPLGLLAADDFYIEQDADFEVLGLDRRSVVRMHELGRFIAENLRRDLGIRSSDYGGSIQVSLRPADKAGFSEHYLLSIGAHGEIALDFRWDETLSLEQTCYALTLAYVTRYLYYDAGLKSLANTRTWPVAALATRSYLQLRPGQISTMVESSRQEIPLQLNRILELKGYDATAAYASRDGYWLWVSLDRLIRLAPVRVRELMLRSLQGQDIAPVLEAILQPDESDLGSLDGWWQACLQELLGRSHFVFESLDESRAWMEQVADLSTVELEGDAPLNLRRIWTHRSEDPVRVALQARVELIQLRLPRINPAYYNSAVTLGILYQTLLDSEQKFEYIGALAKFLGEFEDMKRTHETIRLELESAG
ncbi:hypothetical protein [Coraliomargarita parva]|uniref:hypothetical protein n=1 Tax=Coraliomargarita parva TaxID=3014050 RepID=UPI0022B34B17|nr:hypothetical protein [Coraliomargarita parva]